MIVALLLCTMQAAGQERGQKLDAYCKAAEATGRFHGYVLVKQKDRVLLSRGYGYSNAVSKNKGTAVTRYQVGSVTKQFTAAIILKLAEQGRISLEDPVSKYFPEFPKADRVTIEHLLTHTSGIHNYTNNRGVFDSLRGMSSTQRDMMRMIASFPYDFEPGTRWNYSNSGYSLLGYIIEQVTRKSWEQNMYELILHPLGMKHSGFDFAKAPAVKATGYYMLSEAEPAKAAIIDSSISFAAGALYTTPADLLAWDEALLSGKAMDKGSLQNAWTPRLNKYGLGWFIDTIHGKPAIHHGGAIDGFMTQNILVPEEQTSIIVMVNAEMFDADKAARDILGILQGVPIELPRQPREISVPDSLLQSYAGRYAVNGEMQVTVKVEGGKLMVAPDGQPWAQLFPETETLFFFKIMDAKIEFIRGDTGKVVKFLFRQGGQVMEAARTE